MAYRKFKDKNGNNWEVREQSRDEWYLEPVSGNPGSRKVVQSPGYEKDPFEMSEGELQRLLGTREGEARSKPTKSPFLD